MELRPFTLDDYDQVIALWRSEPGAIGASRSDEPAELAKLLARDPELFLVAEEAGRVVGTVIGGFDGRRGVIYHLAVQREYRGRGLGRALMEEIERRLTERGCLRAYALVFEDNEGVMEFYRRLGWERNPVACVAKNFGPSQTTRR
ncbi:MAG: GNAT family acetyltransferase [Armatimonadetes bacterium]|nr:GNAT family acetyltransferase [Armatimonadota bacterium]